MPNTQHRYNLTNPNLKISATSNHSLFNQFLRLDQNILWVVKEQSLRDCSLSTHNICFGLRNKRYNWKCDRLSAAQCSESDNQWNNPGK